MEKGSVCAFFFPMLEEAAIKCGLFTSPHLIRLMNDFRLTKEMVSDEAFCRLFLKKSKRLQMSMREERLPSNYFEFLFLMGMVILMKADVDLLVQVGLGGRFRCDKFDCFSACLRDYFYQSGSCGISWRYD